MTIRDVIHTSAELTVMDAHHDVTSHYVINTRPEVMFGPSVSMESSTPVGGGAFTSGGQQPGIWASAPVSVGTAYDPLSADGKAVPGIWASADITTEGAFHLVLYRPVMNIHAMIITQTTYSWG